MSLDTAIPRDSRIRDSETFRDFMTSFRAYAHATDDIAEAKRMVAEVLTGDGVLAYLLPLEKRAILEYAFAPDN